MSLKVSVIIPVYNCKDYLEECLKSVINQTLREIEIILVDDGSTDGSGELAEKLSERDPRIKVIHQKNMGAASARNSGIKIASGEYIGFVDSDDYIDERMYEILYSNTENYVEIVQCNYIEIDKNNKNNRIIANNMEKLGVLEKEYIQENIIPSFASNINRGFYCLWNKIYKREWINKENLSIDESLEIAEDWWFNIICFSKVNTMRFVGDELYYYIHQNNDSLMSKYRKNQFELQLVCRKRICDLLKNYDISRYKKEFNIRFLNSLTSNILLEFKNNKEFNYIKFRNIIENQLIFEAAISYNYINNITKISWFLIMRKQYWLSYIVFKLIYIIFSLKNN